MHANRPPGTVTRRGALATPLLLLAGRADEANLEALASSLR